MTLTIDINSDLGEGYGIWQMGDDARMLDLVSSANVACSFHAGDPDLILIGLAGAPILRQAAEAELATVAQALADRAYAPTGQLVFRREPGSVLHDPEMIARRMLSLATEGVIEAIDGSPLLLHADSICVHSDSPDAVSVAARIRAMLHTGGVSIRSFTEVSA